jgi:hypothetical protein
LGAAMSIPKWKARELPEMRGLEQAWPGTRQEPKGCLSVVDAERHVWLVLGDGPRDLRGRIELARLAKQAHAYERIVMLDGKPASMTLGTAALIYEGLVSFRPLELRGWCCRTRLVR